MGCGASTKKGYKDEIHVPSSAPAAASSSQAEHEQPRVRSAVTSPKVFRLLSASRADLSELLDGTASLETPTASCLIGPEDDEAELAWGDVPEVVLAYAAGEADVAEGIASRPKRPSTPAQSPAPRNISWRPGGEGDLLQGPVLNRETAYGMILSWVCRTEDPQQFQRSVFDVRRLLECRCHALQLAELDALLRTKFDDSVPVHRRLAFSTYAKFIKLHDSGARPESCSRCGNHWGPLGFQGQDFATDLRGVGLLGLLHLLSFLGSYPETAREFIAVNVEREHRFGQNGPVPIACASLNFSSTAVLALRNGKLSAICKQAKSVHGGLLKVHAALMLMFVREFRGLSDGTVECFKELLVGLGTRLDSGPVRLLREFQEATQGTSEHSTALRFALIRQVPEGPPDDEIAKMQASRSSRVSRPRFALSPGVSPLARACSSSSLDEIANVFRIICRDAPDSADVAMLTVSPEDLRRFLCDTLGYGQEEVDHFVHLVDADRDGRVDFVEFQRGYRLLNSYRIRKREGQRFLRKPGSISGQQIVLEDLSGCDVSVLDHVGSCTCDTLSGCEVVIGPSEASVFVRDCEDCVFYIAAQQLRTRRCNRCTFFLYSSTEPILEASTYLRLAPLAIAYKGLADHMGKASLNPRRNFWNAIFDFSSPGDDKRNWQLAPHRECAQYRIVLECGAGPTVSDSEVFPPVSVVALNAAPLVSGQNVGQRIDGCS